VGHSGFPVVKLLGRCVDHSDRLDIGSRTARVGLLGRCSWCWRTRPDIDHVVRHLSTEGDLAEQRCIGRPRQCANRQRHLGSRICVRMVSEICYFCDGRALTNPYCTEGSVTCAVPWTAIAAPPTNGVPPRTPDSAKRGMQREREREREREIAGMKVATSSGCPRLGFLRNRRNLFKGTLFSTVYRESK
jgi:hypothetical protein